MAGPRRKREGIHITIKPNSPWKKQDLENWAAIEGKAAARNIENASDLCRALIDKYAREWRDKERKAKGLSATPLSRMCFPMGTFLTDPGRSKPRDALVRFLRANPLGSPNLARRHPIGYEEGWNSAGLSIVTHVTDDDSFHHMSESLRGNFELPFPVRTCQDVRLSQEKHGEDYRCGVLDATMMVLGFVRAVDFLREHPEYMSITGYGDWVAASDDEDRRNAETDSQTFNRQSRSAPTSDVVPGRMRPPAKRR